MDAIPLSLFSSDSRITRRRERTFEMAIPALVQGRDALESDFTEKIEVSSLSAQEAVFWLSAKVLIGSKLVLLLQIPRTFLLERPLEVKLAGTVQYVRSDLSVAEKDQLVSIRLDRTFRIDAPRDA